MMGSDVFDLLARRVVKESECATPFVKNFTISLGISENQRSFRIAGLWFLDRLN